MQDDEEFLITDEGASKTTFRSLSILAILGVELIICILRLVLASLWGFVNGVMFSVLGILLVMGGCVAYQRKWLLPRSIATFFSSKTFNIGYWLLTALIIGFVLILLLIQVSAWDKNVKSFPSDCKKTTNCCRITNDTSSNVHADDNTTPYINGTLSYARDMVQHWIDDQYETEILKKTDTFIHVRFITAFWGFPDDFYVELSCVGNANYDGTVQISIQSESRLGSSDFGVNKDRVDDFLNYVKDQKPQKGSSCE